MFESLVFDGISKRVSLNFQFIKLLQHFKYISVILTHQLDQIGKCAVLTFVVYPQKPYKEIHVAYSRSREEILLLFLASAYVAHYDLSDFRAIDRIRKITWVYRVETVRMERIIKVYRVKLRLYLEAVVMIQQFVKDNFRKIRVFVIVHEQGISLTQHLSDEMAVYGCGLATSGNSENQGGTLWRDYIGITVTDLSFILIPERNVHTQIILDQLFTLLECIPIIRQIGIETTELPTEKY